MAVSQLDSCALLPFSAGQLTPMQAIEARHAVRSYIDEPLAPEAVEVLREAIARVNEEANLNIQLVLDEPRAFTGFKARLVNFTNVRNYLALVGPECK
ncbi:nitroreductase family protein, partial [Ellagibacter isourolithinifaciens]